MKYYDIEKCEYEKGVIANYGGGYTEDDLKNTIIKRFGELEKGDIIFQYGVLFRIVDVWMYERDDGKIVVRFKTEPYNQATVEMVGRTAAYGTYGGVSTLEMTCYIGNR